MMSRPQSSTEGEAAASQHEKPNRKSNLLLWALLAAALIIIYRLSFDKIRTNKTLQTLKEEKGALQEDNKVLQEINKVLSEETEALRKHILDHVCLKLDINWEKHGDKCYYFNNFTLSWNGSRGFCEVLEADLANINSREEQEFLVEKIKNFMMADPWNGFWIGLTDSEVEGNWIWVDGSPLDSSMKFWENEESMNSRRFFLSGEKCVFMSLLGRGEYLNTWVDDACSFAHKSICEKPAGTGPSSSVCG